MPKGIEAILPKLARAKQHIEHLESALWTFYNGAKRPCAVSAKDYLASGKTLYEVEFVADIPNSIPLLIGDALQNLRTSLDYLAWELVLAAGAAPGKRTSFPITETPEKYLSDSPGKVAGMRQEVIDKIAALKPYKGGNEALWRLHALNNGDKHRLLITCVTTASARFGTGQEDGIPTFTTEFFYVPLKKGAKFVLPIAKDQDNSKITCEVMFDEPGIVEREPVMAVLNQITDVVTNLISGFTPFLI